MKKIILLSILVASLTSCTFSGSYMSSDQNFEWSTSIVVPVNEGK